MPTTCRRAVVASDVVPVLTAHPTEIRRRTIQSIQTAVAALMERRDRVEMNRVEEAEWSDELWRQIVTLWQTAMLRLTKLRLRDEVNDAMRYFELSLLSQGPMLNCGRQCRVRRRPDRERPMLRIGSWIGGDRDGNPFVTADVLADTFNSRRQWRWVTTCRSCGAWRKNCRCRHGSSRSRRRSSSWPRLRRHVAIPARRAVPPSAAGYARPAGGDGADLIGRVPGNPPIGERPAYDTPSSCSRISTSSTRRCTSTVRTRWPTAG